MIDSPQPKGFFLVNAVFRLLCTNNDHIILDEGKPDYVRMVNPFRRC